MRTLVERLVLILGFTVSFVAAAEGSRGAELFEAVLECAAKSIDLGLDISEDLLHGAAWERYNTFIRDETLEKAQASNAVLVGAVGGPKWDHIVRDGGPEEQDGLMKLRHHLKTFACLRHARAHTALLDRTAFKPTVLSGADIMVMRELCF